MIELRIHLKEGYSEEGIAEVIKTAVEDDVYYGYKVYPIKSVTYSIVKPKESKVSPFFEE